MKNRSDDEGQREALYEKIIGLGERSIRKSYYPELQQKIIEFETTNKKLALELIERQRREEEIKRNYENQTVLNSLLKLSLKNIPFDELFQITVDNILSLSWLSPEGKAAIFVVEDVPEVLVLKAESGFPKQVQAECAKIQFGKCLCGLAASTGEVQFSSHLDERYLNYCGNIPPHGQYCVPMLLDGRSIGVISLILQDYHRYDPKEEEVLASIANTMAGIIQRKLMMEQRVILGSKLRQSQKMEAIGTLAGGIAHDFNNILSAIMGYTEIAMADSDNPERLRQDLNQVIKGAGRAKELVKQILTFSRRGDQQLKPLSIQLIIKEALKLLRSSIPTTIEMRQNIDPDCAPVLADPTEIHQLIMNLCTNAYHAMRESGGVIGISLQPIQLQQGDLDKKINLAPGSYLKLEVSDTGVGMTKDLYDKIFEPYFTTKEKGEGTGLGLAAVHGIVTTIHGDISVYSEPGQGTTFIVYLPTVAEASRETTPDEDAAPIPMGNERILLVDDDASIVDLNRELLSGLGYEVTAYTSSVDTFDVFQNRPDSFDLVITDMSMPGMTGAKLAEEILTIRPGMPIILCTGFSEMINEEKARSLGIRAFIMKPYLKKDLAVTIRNVLDGSTS